MNVQPVGKVRLAKWFTTMPPKAKAKIVKDVTQLVLARRTRMCNFLEYKGVALSASTLYNPRLRSWILNDEAASDTAEQTPRLCTVDTRRCSLSVESGHPTMNW